MLQGVEVPVLPSTGGVIEYTNLQDRFRVIFSTFLNKFTF